MKKTDATASFTLAVFSANTADVWPLKAREDKEMDDRIQEHYWADADDAHTVFHIRDMDDLIRVLKFYEGTSATMSLVAVVETPEFRASASLQTKWQGGIQSHFNAVESADVSPGTAAKKLLALAHAMERWNQKNPLSAKSPDAGEKGKGKANE